MSEWKEYKLSDLVTKLGDGLHGTPKYDPNGDYYFINGSNLINGKISVNENTKKVTKEEFEKHKKVLTNRTIFVSINGTLGNIALYNDEKVVLGKSACYFNIKDDVSKEFIKYIVTDHSFQHYIYEYATGSTIKNVPLKAIRDYTFKIPDLPTQTAIAEILSSLDDKIELNNKINQELENLAQTLFKQWFIDFEFPNENGEPYKSSGGEMVDSELGEIPEGWEVGLLNKIASLDKRNVKPYENPEKQYFHYSLPDFDNGKKPSITNGKEILSSKYKITPFSILVSKLNPRIPRVWIITDCKENSICSTEFQVIKPKKIEYFSFICTLCSSDTFFDSLKSKVTGTSSSHQRVNPNDIINYKFPIPKDDIILKFESIISDVFIKKNNHIIENSSLILTRNTLLPKLISGELEINEISN